MRYALAALGLLLGGCSVPDNRPLEVELPGDQTSSRPLPRKAPIITSPYPSWSNPDAEPQR
jgi:hypothetical protein